MSFKGFL